MPNSLTPDNIVADYINGKLNLRLTLDLLLSILEKSDKPEMRRETILAFGKVEYYDEKVLDYVENSLLSDEDATVRAAAVKFMGQVNLKNRLRTLTWVIQHEQSPIVIKSIIDATQKVNFKQSNLISEDISNWIRDFSKLLGIVTNEVRFFLNVEAFFCQFINDNEINARTFEYYKKLSSINEDPWLIIKNEHVELLNFNFFNWYFLKKNQDILDSYLEIKNLFSLLHFYRKFDTNAFFSIELLGSIRNFEFLKSLSLKNNELREFPVFLTEMLTIRHLDLSHNFINEIPESISNLKSLKTLKLINNNIHEIPEALKFFLQSLKKFEY